MLAMVGIFIVTAFPVQASTANDAGHPSIATILIWIALILVAGKLASFVERWRQPAVLGELVVGVILGNLNLLGIHILEPITDSSIIQFLAELGVIILLFQIGLESNIQKMRTVGFRALAVACIGVVVPFVLGTYVIGPLLLPGLSANAYLFLGATLTATSVGITARVFKDLRQLHTAEAQIVLGAAVIDDVLGLIILAVVSAIATSGGVSALEIGIISGKAVVFLVGAIVLGTLLAPRLGRFFSRVSSSSGMKLTLALSFGLAVAALAQLIGLAPIVGAFAAGLVLDPVHFQYFDDPHFVSDVTEATAGAPAEVQTKVQASLRAHANRHIEELLEPIGHFLVPIFFVLTGMNVELSVLSNPRVVLVALGITVVAFAGKIVAGAVAGKVKRWQVGWGMVPRGEVGLIFATIGKQLGVVNDEVFSVIVIVVILTTLLTPPILASLLRRSATPSTSPSQA
jgi:Kef-type K+ transport system membrane component KefB